MAKRRIQGPLPLQSKDLTLEDIEHSIRKLKRRIEDVKVLDPNAGSLAIDGRAAWSRPFDAHAKESPGWHSGDIDGTSVSSGWPTSLWTASPSACTRGCRARRCSAPGGSPRTGARS